MKDIETPEERRILAQYRALSDNNKRLFIHVLRLLKLIKDDTFGNDTICNPSNNIITLNHCTITGNGNTFVNNVLGGRTYG